MANECMRLGASENADQKPGCRRGNPAEDVPEDRQVSIFKEEQADRETDYPWNGKKAE
jgi:hypothetical protein